MLIDFFLSSTYGHCDSTRVGIHAQCTHTYTKPYTHAQESACYRIPSIRLYRQKPKIIYSSRVRFPLFCSRCLQVQIKNCQRKRQNAGSNKPDAETLRKAVVLIDWHWPSFKGTCSHPISPGHICNRAVTARFLMVLCPDNAIVMSPIEISNYYLR